MLRPAESKLRSDGLTNNQRGRRSGPCHIVPTALLVRVQCLKKGPCKAVEGPSSRPIVPSMINGSYCRRRRRLSKIEKVPMDIQGAKSSKDMASSRNLVSTIGAQASPKKRDGTRCPEG